ncbi:hypothetical protein SAMN04488544_1359 [Microlunatus sagamiharensis]|uniref:Uncharacterized protein n=1 Tax=Microlunatus sagamiharensis TaxID=546874 RepID=A0A1H2M3V1_9ACTN|nr:hypothetical protein [Microlunatus sagamiharensis]SDU87937.1 hypothetical protein SAMN04488544_1359 [Microlunatus sagamiharensis]
MSAACPEPVVESRVRPSRRLLRAGSAVPGAAPRRLLRALTAAVVVPVLAVLGVLVAPSTATAAPSCAPVDIYYNTPNGYLYRYTPTAG